MVYKIFSFFKSTDNQLIVEAAIAHNPILKPDLFTIPKFPYLFYFDLRIFTTICALYFVIAHLFKINLISKKKIAQFSYGLQGVLLTKYCLLFFSMLINPAILKVLSNTITFTGIVYLALFIVDIILFIILSRISAPLKPTFGWTPFSIYFIYYAIYNILSLLKIDIYTNQIFFVDNTIICIIFTLISSFYGCVICPEINKVILI